MCIVHASKDKRGNYQKKNLRIYRGCILKRGYAIQAACEINRNYQIEPVETE